MKEVFRSRAIALLDEQIYAQVVIHLNQLITEKMWYKISFHKVKENNGFNFSPFLVSEGLCISKSGQNILQMSFWTEERRKEENHTGLEWHEGE